MMSVLILYKIFLIVSFLNLVKMQGPSIAPSANPTSAPSLAPSLAPSVVGDDAVPETDLDDEQDE